MRKRLGLGVLATLGFVAATAAHADTQPGFYAGVGFGTTTIDDDGFDGAGIDDSDTGFKFFGGYSLNENFAIEAAYFDFGKASGRFDDPFFGSASFDVGVSGLSASVIGRLPVTQTVALYGKVGFASYDVDASVNIAGMGGSGSQSETDMIYGIGGSLSFAQRFEARVEYEALDLDGGDASMISISGLYRF